MKLLNDKEYYFFKIYLFIFILINMNVVCYRYEVIDMRQMVV